MASFLLLGCLAASAIASGHAASVYPSVRFTPWSDLSDDQRASAALGKGLAYTETTWNNPGTNEVEGQAFSDMGARKRTGARSLGFGEDSWNCWVNHYNAYGWSDLGGALKGHFEILGWTEETWGNSDKSDAWLKKWCELTQPQQAAAVELCYLEETWDGVPLTEWDTYEAPCLAGPTSAPTSSPSANPTGPPTDVPTPAPTTPSPTASAAPTDVVVPTKTPTVPPSKSPTTDGIEGDGVCTAPYYTFDWVDLPPNVRNVAEGVGYTETVWNDQWFPDEYEDTDWDDLDDSEKGAFSLIGHNRGSWNNFYYYFWFEDLPGRVKVASEKLGWSEDIWCEGEDSTTGVDDKYWDDLTMEEQQAMTIFGYDCYTWDNDVGDIY